MAVDAITSDRRVFQRVIDYVEQAIVGGDLKPGDRLPSERELGEKFGIGRASVREALRVLEHMEIVRSQPRDPRGPLILPLSLGPIRRSVELLANLGYLDLPELIQLRMVVDSTASLLASLRRTDQAIVSLERNMARMREAVPLGYTEFSVIDMEFHELVALAGGNKLMRLYGDLTRESVLNLIRQPIVDAADSKAHMLQSLRHHRAVFSAIVARDGARASRLVREGLYAYYSPYVGEEDRKVMAELVKESGGTADQRIFELSDEHSAG